ncbi:MAG TPA: iron-sulfur cluster assembly protein, partial [Phycisphaerales bacterium]|nr:iron-sulfur cluster assembly protein [Phycisphaerales bacterium]
MPFDKDTIRLALTRVAHPTLGTDIVSAGAVSKIAYCDGYASVRLAAAGLHDDQRRGLTQQVTAAVRLGAHQNNEPLHDVHVELTDDKPQMLPASEAKPGQAVAGPPAGRAGAPAP